MGDEILAAGHAQRVFDADPSKRVAICDRSGAVRWHELWDGNPILATPAEVRAGEPVQRIRNAIGCRPYIQYPFTHQTGLRVTAWRANDHRGRIYLTELELLRGAYVRVEIGPYVVMEASPKRATNANKHWIADRWDALVAACPDVTFLQLRHPETRVVPGARQVTTYSFRDACAVLASAKAYVGTEGGLHHAAAALGVPAVVLFGGCIDPTTTGYDTHVNLADTGPGSPCGRFLPCAHCRAAMARIEVTHVAAALQRTLRAKVAA